MTVGDVVTLYGVAVSTNQYLDFQPAPGVEELLINFYLFASANATVTLYYYNGSVTFPFGSVTVGSNGYGSLTDVKMFINNSWYLRTYSSSTYKVLAVGMQTKGSMLKVGDKILKGDEVKAYREEWLKKRKEELMAKTETVEYVDVDGSKKSKTLKVKQIVEDRDDLGDLRGIFIEWGQD